MPEVVIYGCLEGRKEQLVQRPIRAHLAILEERCVVRLQDDHPVAFEDNPNRTYFEARSILERHVPWTFPHEKQPVPLYVQAGNLFGVQCRCYVMLVQPEDNY